MRKKRTNEAHSWKFERIHKAHSFFCSTTYTFSFLFWSICVTETHTHARIHTCAQAQFMRTYNTVRSHSLPLIPHYSMNVCALTHIRIFFSLPYSPLSPSHSQNTLGLYFGLRVLWKSYNMSMYRSVCVVVCVHAFQFVAFFVLLLLLLLFAVGHTNTHRF